MAQLIRITSEALQATIRRLLPSQQGFGEDLQASNVITPIIDLTPSAEGSALPGYLQTAASHGNVTSSVVTNQTNTVYNTAGFIKVQYSMTCKLPNSGTPGGAIQLWDGTTAKIMVDIGGVQSDSRPLSFQGEFIALLDSGDGIRVVADANTFVTTAIWQLADRQGNLTDPAGYQPQ